MAWWMAVPIALQAAGSIASAIGQYKQADLTRKYGNEQVRRMRLEHDKVIGETTARAASSGFEFGKGYEDSSSMVYLDQMAKEFRFEEDWLRKMAAAEAKAQKTASLFSAFGGIGSSIMSYGQMTGWGK